MQNIHPLFVHFPVALSLTALLFEVLYLVSKKDHFKTIAAGLIVLTAVAAVVTAATGLVAANTVPHPDIAHPLMDTHKEIELAGVALSILASLSLVLARNKLSWVRGLLVLATAATISYGASYGGRLVFDYGVGTALVKTGMVDSTGSGNMNNMDMSRPNTTTHHGEVPEQSAAGEHGR